MVNSIFGLIENNKDHQDVLVADEGDLNLIASDFRSNRHLWRVTTTGDKWVRFVRMGGGGGVTSHNGFNDEIASSSTFLIARELFPEFYCEFIAKSLGCHQSLRRIQQYQADFDIKKDATVKSVEFDDKYAVVCLTEELGEFARAVKKGARAVVNEDMALADHWKNEERKEATDMLVYLVKVFNKNGWDMSDSYYEIMEANHGELDKGGGKYKGTSNPANDEPPKVEITQPKEVNQ